MLQTSFTGTMCVPFETIRGSERILEERILRLKSSHIDAGFERGIPMLALCLISAFRGDHISGNVLIWYQSISIQGLSLDVKGQRSLSILNLLKRICLVVRLVSRLDLPYFTEVSVGSSPRIGSMNTQKHLQPQIGRLTHCVFDI